MQGSLHGTSVVIENFKESKTVSIMLCQYACDLNMNDPHLAPIVIINSVAQKKYTMSIFTTI